MLLVRPIISNLFDIFIKQNKSGEGYSPMAGTPHTHYTFAVSLHYDQPLTNDKILQKNSSKNVDRK
jgi:hypothetical protein